MTHPALTPRPLTRAALILSPRAGGLLVLAGLMLAGAWSAEPVPYALGLLLSGLSLGFLAALVRFLAWRHRRGRERYLRTVKSLIEHDAAPGFVTDADGQVTFRNEAARERFGAGDGGDAEEEAHSLASVLGDLFASPQAVLGRLQNKAQITGSAREDVVLRRGHMRLSAQRIAGEGFLWRLEELGERGQAGRSGESINLPMMTVSRTGTILYMNEAMRRFLGGRQTALDRVFADLPVANGRVAMVSTADGVLPRLVCEIASSAGRREIYLLPEPGTDIVEPEQWDLVDALPVPLLKLDETGRISMANRRARRLLGDDDPVGSMLSDQVEGAGRPISEWLRDVMTGRPAGRSEVVRALKPENEVFLQISLERVSEPEGRVLVAVLQDATELKTMEAQYLQSQKMQAIGQLAGGVAHDFNNLLTAISGHCDLLLMRHDEADQDYADLSQIRQNANRAATLVGQLLSFSRKQTLRPEIIDLSETLDDLTHLLNRLVGETVDLVLNQDADILPIRADKRHLEQVLMNLVVNARDAMPEGGTIRIETRNLILDTPLKRDRATVPAGEYVRIKVVDQGIGIPPERLSKVFEPFFTTKGAGKGTGLGLSMAYGIVKQTGGFIFVDSEVGAGTEFTLFFPVALPDTDRSNPGGADTFPEQEGRTRQASGEIAEEIPPNTETLVLEAPVEPPVASETEMAKPEMTSVAETQAKQREVDATLDADEKRAADDADGVEEGAKDAEQDSEEASLREIVARISGTASSSAQSSMKQEPEPPREVEAARTCPEPQEQGRSLPAPTHPQASLAGVVLLVEDEAPVRAFASRALRMRGFTVLEAENAEEALKTLEDQSLQVDVFVTDVIMPGMDGPTWVSKALKSRPGVKVVFVSGYAEDSVSEHQARIPNSVFLPKPFSLSELTSTVKRQLH